ncbi:hypothetical protein [uncultured Brevibacterium sp.]|uniref:hypothetical protein n=1 Tax=uncultured Brevibacterium sp. TaxID=189678 RepID=UPI0025FC1199|nr:hypothetical protein [uncultured Brevibacterium sp.]
MSFSEATFERVFATAGWAPSAHNTQPWVPQVTSVSESRASVTVRVDPQRTLPVTDPHAMDLGLSLGCWVEVANIALGVAGAHFSEVRVLGEGHGMWLELEAAEVGTGAGTGTHETDSGAGFEPAEVLDRQVDRGKLVPRTDRLEEALSQFAQTNFAYTSGPIASAQIPEPIWSDASRYAQAAALSPREALDETLEWLRLDDTDPRYYQDGLTAETLRIPRAVARTGARLVKAGSDTLLNAVSRTGMWSTMLPTFASRKAPDRVVLALHRDHASQVSAEEWVQAGRDLLRLWLILARHGLRVAVESQLKDTPLSAAMLCDVLRRTDPHGRFVPFAVFSVGESAGEVPKSHRLVEQRP